MTEPINRMPYDGASSRRLMRVRTMSSKRPKHRTQYNDSNKCDNYTDDHSHHHIEITLAVGQSADLEHSQDRAIVGEGVERAGADRGQAMQQRGIDAMLDGEAHVGVTECIERERKPAGG